MHHEIGTYLITSLTIILLMSGITGIVISIYLYKYRKTPGILYLLLLQIAIAAWAFFYALEYSATVVESKIFWSKLSYLGIVFAPVFFYLFSLHFAYKQHRINATLLASLFGLSTIFLISVTTNDYHFLHWKSYHIDPILNTTIYTYGVSFWLVFAFNYILLTLSIANIIPLIFKYPENYQQQIIFIVIACVFPVVGNVMYVFNVGPIQGFDWTPIFFAFSGVILTYINLRFGIFDLIPIARNKLLSILPDGVIIVDKHRRIADVNPAFLELTHRSKNDTIGKSLADVFPKQKSLIDQLAPKEQIESMELEAELSGQLTYFDIRVTSLFDQANQMNGKLIVLRNITEKTINQQSIQKKNQQLKKEIEEKEKLIADLDAFDHTVAHDLKNVIGAILTSNDLLKLEIEQKNYQNLEEIIELIQLSANKSFHVIKELLTMASVRQQDIKREQVDMADILKECEIRLDDMIKTSKATIIKPREWPTALGYSPWIEEVWVNYISNAIKYGGKPPVLELGAKQFYREKKIRYWIKDNGNGLPQQDQTKLFKKYERFNQTPIEGTGLGLSIVKRIVEKLGGEVGVISAGIKGEGCIFYFTLPQE
ncbi:histidine kinase N-terminal 7TM domain-containing protein [uncultured Sunxiuqinia sp.]|uniref:histidine kinase N-terminal 7TM domain-containing protein n=1 Tax=uncultured Sunxiuqinia sp. TaxID=1573825 RepID=UPI002AA7275A|nr:histidine kinase N-terminal 7TM domain-containing protein [uncultured Sunxiuqinia sp.]